jgi:O-antigen/teichoic acid export membrane protein
VREPAHNGEDQPQSLAKTTLHGALWMTAGRFMKAPTNLLTVAILARLLTPADFGVVAIGLVVIGLGAILVDGSFGMVLVQRQKMDPPMIGASLVLSLSLGTLFAVALLAGAPLLERYFDFPHLTGVIRVLALALPVSAAMAVTTALLQRASRFGILTINSFLAQLLNAVVAISLAFSGFGVWSLVWGQFAQVCFETFLGFTALRSRYSIGFSLAALKDGFRSGGMFTLSKLFNWAGANIDNVVVGTTLGATSLGLYSRPSTLMNTVNQVIGTGTARVLFSTFAKMQHDLGRMRRAFERALATSLVAASFAAAFVLLFSNLIVHLMLGPKWVASVPIMQALFAAFVTRSGYIVAEAVPLALGLGRASAYRQGAQFILVLAGAWLGSHFGVTGAAIGIAVAYWLFYLLCLLLVQQLLSVPWSKLVSMHLSALAAIAVPVLATIAIRYAMGSSPSLWSEVPPLFAFGASSLAVLAFAPAIILSDDIVRGRGHLVGLVGRRFGSAANAP